MNTYNDNYIGHDKNPHHDAFVVSSSIPGEGKDTRLLCCKSDPYDCGRLDIIKLYSSEKSVSCQ